MSELLLSTVFICLYITQVGLVFTLLIPDIQKSCDIINHSLGCVDDHVIQPSHLAIPNSPNLRENPPRCLDSNEPL
jgi:hypothetical protein